MLKGFHINLLIGATVTWLVFFSPATNAASNDIVLLMSSDNPYFQGTAEVLRTQSGNRFQFSTVILDDNAQARSPLPETTNRVITFGSKAAAYAIHHGLADQAIASYLTHEQYLAFERESFHAVALLDQPLSRYLTFSDTLMPGASVGTLYTDNTILPALPEAGARSGLQTAGPVSSDHLLSRLREFLVDIDIFLMTPNHQLFNRNSLRGILLTTYRASKPVVSFSPSHVRSGALGSIFSSPQDIGKHLSDMLAESISSPSQPLTDVQFARYYSIAINRKVARSLAINLPDDETILSRLKRALEK